VAVDDGAVLGCREWIAVAVAVALGLGCTLVGRIARSRTGLVAADNSDCTDWTCRLVLGKMCD